MWNVFHSQKTKSVTSLAQGRKIFYECFKQYDRLYTKKEQ